jgi:hypothetical protein
MEVVDEESSYESKESVDDALRMMTAGDAEEVDEDDDDDDEVVL